MLFYCAPMEGITGYPYRNTHNKMFPGTDRYYMPFLSVHPEVTLSKKEKKEINPENNRDYVSIPQILGNNAEGAAKYAIFLKNLGYNEININAGCPSKTVTSKHKGAGMLDDPYMFDKFLNELFTRLDGSDINISLKTRIGMREKENIPDLIKVYNKYPFCEVIIHPRLGTDQYKGSPDMDSFDIFYKKLIHPVCYNGDIKTTDDIEKIVSRYPKLHAIMTGRGLLADPCLIVKAKGGDDASMKHIESYTRELYKAWTNDMQSPDMAMLRMKELWTYQKALFEHSEKYIKEIMKARSPEAYNSAVYAIFHSLK